MDHPTEGQVIKVLYRPKSHDVKLNPEDWKYSSGKPKSEKQAEDQRFEAAEHGSPGQAVAPVTGGSAADQLTELGARHERGELTDDEYEAAMDKVWSGELGLPRRS